MKIQKSTKCPIFSIIFQQKNNYFEKYTDKDGLSPKNLLFIILIISKKPRESYMLKFTLVDTKSAHWLAQKRAAITGMFFKQISDSLNLVLRLVSL